MTTESETARPPINPATRHLYKCLITGLPIDVDPAAVVLAAGKSAADFQADKERIKAGWEAAKLVRCSAGIEAIDDAEQLLAQSNLDSAVPKLRAAAAAMRDWRAATREWEAAVAAVERLDAPQPLRFGRSLEECEAEQKELKKQREQSALAVAEAKQSAKCAQQEYLNAVQSFEQHVQNSLFEPGV